MILKRIERATIAFDNNNNKKEFFCHKKKQFIFLCGKENIHYVQIANNESVKQLPDIQ